MDMKIFEDIADDIDNSSMRYDPQDDTLNKRNIFDTRKNKLTLKMINKLKKMRIAKNIENINKKKLLGLMYTSPAENDG